MSCFSERDPRDMAFAALIVAIVWYRQIEPEQAWRLVKGESNMKPESELTPEVFGRIKQILRSPNCKNFNNIEKTFRINRYRIYEELRKQRQLQ